MPLYLANGSIAASEAQMSDQELGHFLAVIHQANKQAVERLPSHQDFIQKYCKS